MPFKKGTCNDPANYRPVSLTSIICKVAEHIICSHVGDHLGQQQILSDANHGFCQGHSCETQLLLATHNLLKHHDCQHQVDVRILDFSKAFDTVPHRRLIGKLHLYRIGGRILHLPVWLMTTSSLWWCQVTVFASHIRDHTGDCPRSAFVPVAYQWPPFCGRP